MNRLGARSLAGRIYRPARLQLHRPSLVRWRSNTTDKDDPYIEMHKQNPNLAKNKGAEAAGATPGANPGWGQGAPAAAEPKPGLKPPGPDPNNPNNFNPAQMRRHIMVRNTTLFGQRNFWSIMAIAFGVTLGPLALLLLSDAARKKFKEYNPQAGEVIEHFGELIFGMEFDKPELRQSGKMIPIKYDKETTALDMNRPLSSQRPKEDAKPPPTAPPPSPPPESNSKAPLRAALVAAAPPPPSPPARKVDLPPVPTDSDDVGQLIDRLEKIPLPEAQKPGAPRAALMGLQERLTSLRQAAEVIRSKESSALTSLGSKVDVQPETPQAPDLSGRLSVLQADLSHSQIPEPDPRDRLLMTLRDQLVSGKATIVKLREELKRANESVDVMKLNLDEREKYLRDNISLLQEGRDIYNEAVAAYQELAAEAAANSDVRVEQLNGASHQRIRELDILDVEIKAMEHVLEWYSQNRVQSQRAVMMSIGLVQMEDHLKNGRPFEKEMRYIELSSHPESLIGAACATVSDGLRKTGVPTQQQLELKWSQVEPRMREAAMIPEETSSLWNHILAKAASYVMVSERLDKPGDDLQACISRIGFHLEKEDLRKAVSEAESIGHTLSKDVVIDWLDMANKKLLMSEVFRILRADMVLKNVMTGPPTHPPRSP